MLFRSRSNNQPVVARACEECSVLLLRKNFSESSNGFRVALEYDLAFRAFEKSDQAVRRCWKPFVSGQLRDPPFLRAYGPVNTVSSCPFPSTARASQTAARCPTRICSQLQSLVSQTLAVESQLPLTSRRPSLEAWSEHIFPACPVSVRRGAREGGEPSLGKSRTQMSASSPPVTR